MLNQAYPLNFQELGIVTRGLVACYDFQGHGNKLIDRSGNGKHGQLGSAAGADTNDPTWDGKGLSFGGDDWVKSSNLPNNKDEITLEMIVKTGSAVTSNTYLMSVESNSNVIALSLKWGLRIYMAGAWSEPCFTDNTIQPNTIYYSTGIFKKGIVANYINGKQKGLTLTTPKYLNMNAYNLFLGSDWDSKQTWNHSEYFATVYNRALTQTEITQNYNAIKRILAGRGVQI